MEKKLNEKKARTNGKSSEYQEYPGGQFKKGNPGRQVGSKNFTSKVREALLKIAEGKDYTYEEAFIKSILKKAIIDQDSTIMKLIWNYLDGMPAQPLTGADGKDLFPNPETKQKVDEAIKNYLNDNTRDFTKGK